MVSSNSKAFVYDEFRMDGNQNTKNKMESMNLPGFHLRPAGFIPPRVKTTMQAGISQLVVVAVLVPDIAVDHPPLLRGEQHHI